MNWIKKWLCKDVKETAEKGNILDKEPVSRVGV